MLDNQNVAVLSRVNELAERHGLKPYDFVATSKFEEDDTGISQHVLEFEVPAQGNALREERYDRMLKDIGILQGDRAVLRGDDHRRARQRTPTGATPAIGPLNLLAGLVRRPPGG